MNHLSKEQDELVWIDGMITLTEGWLDVAVEYATRCVQQPWYRRRARDEYDSYRYDPSLGLRASLLCDELLRLTNNHGPDSSESHGDYAVGEYYDDAALKSWVSAAVSRYLERQVDTAD
ncbi:MAG: hypothetical protein SFX74_05005 [Fimbriimonadaceae bacterium]|nr:hypothetical protein [Fimbriimonadaceae bacterium]